MCLPGVPLAQWPYSLGYQFTHLYHRAGAVADRLDDLTAVPAQVWGTFAKPEPLPHTSWLITHSWPLTVGGPPTQPTASFCLGSCTCAASCKEPGPGQPCLPGEGSAPAPPPCCSAPDSCVLAWPWMSGAQ